MNFNLDEKYLTARTKKRFDSLNDKSFKDIICASDVETNKEIASDLRKNSKIDLISRET